jgi:branched-chain amino acid transport system ATP-binding protein
MATLRLTDVTAGYHAHQPVIERISLSVESGTIVAMMGANGAGKSTTLATISGLIRASEGRIELDGRRIDSAIPAQILGAGVAHVPEGRRILPGLTVQENLMMGAYTINDRRVEAQLQSTVLELFPALASRLKQFGGTLSGGEQEMLAIGRALMSRPKILLLDEPSMGLAPIVIDRIFQHLLALRDEGLGILLVEQNATMALRVSSMAYVLERGRIVASGTPEIISANEDIRRSYLGG